MPHFNTHMSYSELIRALSEPLAQGRLLTRAEINCVNSSVDEPLMKAVIERYPLRTALKKLLGQSVERERALRPDLDLDVHSAAYGGERDKTALFLRTQFPAQPDIDVIARTKELVQRFIVSNDATFNKQLLQAEKARLKEREREHEAGRLSYVWPAASLEAMQADFIAYTEHLERSKQESSTYAWETLSSLFHRIDTFAEGTPQRADAERLLLSALDSARTAYHVYAKQYVPGKDYTCQKGLEERLLDEHFILTPVEPPSESPLSTFLDRLLTPFITYDADMKGEGNPPACSELLYALYFEAAGYQKVQEAVQSYHLKDKDRVDSLRQQYVASVTCSAEQANITEEQQLQRELKEQRRVIPFNSAVGLLGTASCEELDKQYGEIITFLKSQDAIEQQEITEETVTSPAQPKEHEAIVRAMLESGYFIDANHLHMVLAITGDHDLKTMQEMTKKGKAPESYDETPVSTREELQELHAAYLGAGGVFCHFYDEAIINQRLTNDQMQHSLSIAEPALCLWLSDHPDALSRLQKERLAVLCAKAGYSAAIRVLCSNMPEGGHVSPNHVDSQEGLSLLQMASQDGHTDTARALLDAGANIDLKSNTGTTSLMRASQNGHTDTARALINAGVDVNLKSNSGTTSLMWASQNGHTDIARALINAGADVNVQDRYGWTALMWASRNGHTAIARALLDAGADLNLQHSDGWTAVMWSSYHGDTATARALIGAGADINLQNNAGWTALMMASCYGRIDILRALIDAGADVNLQDRDGNSSLIEASENGDADIVRALIEAGADVNLQDRDGGTALGVAYRNGHTDIARALIDDGADIGLQTPVWLMLQTLCYRTLCHNTPRLIAEKAFIQGAVLRQNDNMISEDLNLNFFQIDEKNALEIALLHHNIPLVQAVLAQESLAPWVVLKALKEHFYLMLPLLGQHERFRRLLTLRKNDFSEQHQYAIASCFERKDLLRDIRAHNPVTFSRSNTSNNHSNTRKTAPDKSQPESRHDRGKKVRY